MESILLILVLFSDPAAEPTAKMLTEDLTLRGGTHVRVLTSTEGYKELEKKGLRDGDLVTSPVLAEQLTSQDTHLAIIRLEHHLVAGDQVVESRVWSVGRCDRHTSITGKGGDPSPAVVGGVVDILSSVLPNATNAADANKSTDFPALVQRQAWKEIVASLATKADKSAREYYYLTFAQVHLKDATAKDTVAAMAKAFPGHFMVKAAEGVLPAEANPTARETPLDK